MRGRLIVQIEVLIVVLREFVLTRARIRGLASGMSARYTEREGLIVHAFSVSLPLSPVGNKVLSTGNIRRAYATESSMRGIRALDLQAARSSAAEWRVGEGVIQVFSSNSRAQGRIATACAIFDTARRSVTTRRITTNWADACAVI
jgi:hypothetical protein